MRPQTIDHIARMPATIAVCVLLASLTAGQTRTAGSLNGVADRVRALENRRFEAMTKGDTAALERILADDLVYTHSSGTVDTKSQYIASIKSGDLKYISIQRDDVNVRVFGNAAVITGRALFKVKSRGQDMTVHARFTDVWIKRRGTWQMVAWQSTRLPEQ